MGVEAILFDVGGTVFDWRTAVRRGFERTAVSRIDGIDLDAVGVEWRKQSLIEIEAIAEERAAWRPFDPVLETSLDAALAVFGIGSLTNADRATLLGCWEQMPVWPEVPAALERLRRRYFIAPHTILSLRVAAFSSKAAGLSWDAIISCDGLGKTKLHPESYALALARLGRPADKVCFAAAHPSDLRAAAAHGMRTAYIVARVEDYGDDYTDTGFADEFDIVAQDFNDLADQLGA